MNNVPMASAISTSTCMCSESSFAVNKANPFTLSTSAIPNLKLQNFRFSALISQLGLSPFSQWNGLRPLDVSISRRSVKIGEGKCKGKTVFASLFGVGAPEAFVIGVVALLVFGPKGLAEVARNLGKTLRAFQPAIKELQDVSREFKSTLEQEIGLDEIQSSTKNISRSNKTQTTSSTSSIASSESRITDPNGSASTKQAYSSEEYLKVTEQQLKAASVAQQQSQIDSPGASQLDSETKSQDTVQKTAAVMPPPQKPETET